MATTPNINLPLIDGSATADVPRDVNALAVAVDTAVSAHTKDKSNPHEVTKAQVGLGNVDNAKQATKAEFDTHVADNVKHITAAERTAWNAKETTTGAQAKVDALAGAGNAKTVKQLDTDLAAHKAEYANLPRAQYRYSVNKELLHNTWTAIPWDIKVFDSNNFIDQADSETIKINKSGLYLITFSVQIEPSITGNRNLRIAKDGVDFAYSSGLGATVAPRCNLSAIQYLNAGSTIKTYAYQDSGVTLQAMSTIIFPAMSIVMIGPPP